MKLSTFNLFLLIVFFNTEIKSQNWNQIGITGPADFNQSFFGVNNPFSQTGVIWDLKFEPEYNGVTQKRLFATGVSSGLYMSESGEGNDWILLNTDFLPETAIGDFVINPIWGKRNEIIIGTGLYKLKFSRNYDGKVFQGKGFFKADLNNNPFSWTPIDQMFTDIGGASQPSTQFWNELNSMKFVSKLIQKDDLTLLTVIIDEKFVNGVKKTNSHVFKSIDGGLNWVEQLTMDDFIVNDIDIDPYNGSHVLISANFAVNNSNPHFFHSNDFGTTWASLKPVLPVIDELTAFYKASFSHTNPGIIFVCRFEPTRSKIFKIDLSNPSVANFYTDATYGVNPGKASAFEMTNDDFFASGSTLVNTFFNFSGVTNPKSSNLNWIEDGVHTDIRAIAYYPMTNDFVVATDGGINKCVYNPNLPKKYSVTNISQGLEMDRVLKISSYQPDKNIYGYTHWDNGPVFRNQQWLNNKFTGLTGNENNCYGIGENQVVTAGLNGDPLIRRNFNFDVLTFNYSWLFQDFGTSMVNFADSFNRSLHASYLTLNDFNKNMLVVGLVHEYQIDEHTPPPIVATGIFIVPYYDATNNTTKAASSICQKVLEPPTFFFPNNPGRIYLQPRMSINNGNIIYTATDRGITDAGAQGITIFKSTNGGFNWTRMNSPQDFGGVVNDIAVDPLDPDQICFAAEKTLVFWNTSTQVFIKNLPAIPFTINTITYVNSNTVLAATDFGLFVFYRDKNGSSEWVDFNFLLLPNSRNLPNLRIADVEYLFKDNSVRVATMGRGVFENFMPINCVKSNISTVVSHNLTIDLPMTSNSDIIITNNSTFTLNTELKMAPGTKITVELGSKILIKSGGVITNLCDNTTWDGIIAFGNNTQPQNGVQAKVEIIQNGSIQNARTAIHSDGGAIINADHARFENCRHSISLVNYTFSATTSRINECVFICNRPIYDYINEPQDNFISLFNIKGLQITGNLFVNSIWSGGTINDYRGKGIHSIDASYTLHPSYSLINASNPNCLTPAGPKNIFRDLSIGIEMNNGTGIANKVDAYENIFENCGEAINIKNSVGIPNFAGTRLFKNSIVMTCIKSGHNNHIFYSGIKFNGSTDFIAEQNTIDMAAATVCNTNFYNYIGIHVSDDVVNNNFIPQKLSYIFKNTISFSGPLAAPFYTVGVVTEGPNANLHLWCNKFDNSLSTTTFQRGMKLNGDLNHQSTINGTNIAADNEFLGFTSMSDMVERLSPATPINYYYKDFILYTGSSNVLANNTGTSKCGQIASNGDFYCSNGKGLIDYIPTGNGGNGGGGDHLPEAMVNIFPNPVNSVLTVSLLNFSNIALDISIINSQGIELINRHYNNISELNTIAIQSLQEGLYSLRAFNNSGQFATCYFIVLRQ